ncbi:MAG: hypothetical protein PVJ57_03485 [Phycisphaerae bacterium]|jgi:hypothetical protein
MRLDDKLHRIAAGLRRCLEHRHLPWVLALLAMLLCLPALRMGWLLDDDFHRAALTRPEFPMLTRSAAELFVFIEGDPAANRLARSMGILPWWSDEHLRIAFFRPLTGFTHWLDYQLWPERPAFMHAHSFIWYGAVVVAAAFLYRRLLGPTWAAGLAALLYAVDDGHGISAAWIANRNELLSVFFGLLTLIAYDRWRRDHWWPGAILAALTFALALLSKESAVAVAAYLFAYALFLDRSTRTRRLACLAPCVFVGVTWWIVYKQLGYGTAGSAWYIDPGAEPATFAQAVLARAPNLLAWQWLIPSDLRWSLSPLAALNTWLVTMVVLALIAAAIARLLRHDRLARFWALGMLLSLLPACAAYPADRLLLFVGIGAMGLLAQFVGAVVRESPRSRALFPLRAATRALCLTLLLIHLVLSPLHFIRTPGALQEIGRSVARAAASLPPTPRAGFQTVLIVNSPTYATLTYGALTRLLGDQPYLSPTFVLGSGNRPIEIRRHDETTLLVRPDGGFFAPLGSPFSHAEMAEILFNQRRTTETLDRLYRDRTPATEGQRVQLLCAAVEITAITDDGRPAEATFHFLMDLDSPLFRWLQWRDGQYVPFPVPAVGQTVTLPAVTM